MYFTTIKSKIGVQASLAVQWLRLRASTAGGAGSITGLRNPQAAWCGKKIKIKIKINNLK